MPFNENEPVPPYRVNIQFDYSLHQQGLEQVQSANFFRITTTVNQDFSHHISIIKPGDQWSCKRSPDILASYNHKIYNTWKKQGQEMTLKVTFNTHILSFTELVVCTFKFSGHLVAIVSSISLFSHFSHTKPKLPNLTLPLKRSRSLQDYHLFKL